MPLPKPTRTTDEDFLDFIRGKGCVVTGSHEAIHAHHLRTRGAGGSDYTAVPLCGVQHQQWHQLGPRKYREVTGVDLWQHNSLLLAEYFSDPVVLLRKALVQIGRPDLERTPDVDALLASLEATLRARSKA